MSVQPVIFFFVIQRNNYYISEKLILKKMKKLILTIIVASIAVTSCQQKKNNETEKTKNQMDSTEQVAEKQTEDKIVTSSVTNNEGVKLDMTFNNTKGTAVFKLNGETIEMKQDTMGSGVKYSNEKYEYSEWHGQIELKKDGKTIFKNTDISEDQKK